MWYALMWMGAGRLVGVLVWCRLSSALRCMWEGRPAVGGLVSCVWRGLVSSALVWMRAGRCLELSGVVRVGWLGVVCPRVDEGGLTCWDCFDVMYPHVDEGSTR